MYEMVGLQLPSRGGATNASGNSGTGGTGGGGGGGGGGGVVPSSTSSRDQFMKALNWDRPAGDPRERGHYSRYWYDDDIVDTRVAVSLDPDSFLPSFLPPCLYPHPSIPYYMLFVLSWDRFLRQVTEI